MYMNRKGVQFSKKDTWSLDYSLSPIILSALLKFKEIAIEGEHNHKGLPFDFHPENKESLTDKEWDEGYQKYIEVIDKMIYAFDMNNKPDLHKYAFDFVAGENHEEETPEGHFRWNMVPDDEVVYGRYREDAKIHEAKVIEGRELFGKYYHTLWW